MKRFVFGLMAVGIALAGSAFTNAPKFNPGDLYGNTSSGTYTSIHSYNRLKCFNNNNAFCGYRELPAGAGIVTVPFTEAQATTWQSLGYITPLSSDRGIYVP